jgi:uncharacterized protein involved in exopolysaccharide biosynthesis
MEQIAILDVLRRHASMIIIICVVTTLAGYGFSFLIPDRYTASALVLVRPQEPKKMGTHSNKEFLDFPMGSAAVVETAGKTYIELIKSSALISEVVRELGLDKDKEAESDRISKLLPDFLKTSVEDLKQFLKAVPAILKYGRVVEDEPFTKAVKAVHDDLKLESHLDTYVFEIKYTAKNSQRAANVANTTAKTLIQFVNDLRLSEAGYQRDHLKTELEQSRQQLIAARGRLESYKKAHSVFLYEPEYESKLKVIAELQVELAKAEAALVGSQNTLLNVSLAAKRARIIRLIGEREGELAPLPAIERELKQLELDVKTAASAYEFVDKEFREADIKLSSAMPEARLVSQADPPRLPSSPLRGTIALASLFCGLVVGIGLSLFLEYLNRRVRGIHDVEAFVGVKVLATIPRVSQSRWRAARVEENRLSASLAGQPPRRKLPPIARARPGPDELLR